MRPITTMRRYEVVSAADAGEDDLHPRERSRALQAPSYVSAQMRELVGTWTAQSDDPRAIAMAALEFFRTQGFVYSLSPGQYLGANALDDLLFVRRTGFCEHYAGAFATLMRLAGVPSRVVVGYLGGQFNEWGNYLLVRQADAHAWCEVWLPNEGWTRVDPTSVIAPERLNLGSFRDLRTTSTSADQANAAPRSPNQRGGGKNFVDEARLAWDSVSYAWDSRVLSFDVDGQREFFTNLGMEAAPGLRHLLWIGLATAALLASYIALLAWRARRPGDAVKTLYETFCRKVARIGAVRGASEGPSDFAARAASELPQHAPAIQRIANLYIALRYAPSPTPPLTDRFASAVGAFPSDATRK
jgi:transglutaminase-like putative cysteine protease